MNTHYILLFNRPCFLPSHLIVAIGGMYSGTKRCNQYRPWPVLWLWEFSLQESFLHQYLPGKYERTHFSILAILISGLTGGILSLLHAFAAINMKVIRPLWYRSLRSAPALPCS